MTFFMKIRLMLVKGATGVLDGWCDESIPSR